MDNELIAIIENLTGRLEVLIFLLKKETELKKSHRAYLPVRKKIDDICADTEKVIPMLKSEVKKQSTKSSKNINDGYKALPGSGFTIITNETLQDSSISLKAKGLLHYLLSLPEDWNISIAGLSNCLDENGTAIRSTIKELEDAGYIRRTRIFPCEATAHKIKYIYEVFECPQHIENLLAEDLNDGNRHADAIG